MSDKIMRAFEDRRSNPFQFKHLQLCHSLAELSQVPEPKASDAAGFLIVVLCTFVSHPFLIVFVAKIEFLDIACVF